MVFFFHTKLSQRFQTILGVIMLGTVFRNFVRYKVVHSNIAIDEIVYEHIAFH